MRKNEKIQYYFNLFFSDHPWKTVFCILLYVTQASLWLLASYLLLTDVPSVILYSGSLQPGCILGSILFFVLGTALAILRTALEKEFDTERTWLRAKEQVAAFLFLTWIALTSANFILAVFLALVIGVLYSIALTYIPVTRDLFHLDYCITFLCGAGYLFLAVQMPFSPDFLLTEAAVSSSIGFLLTQMVRTLLSLEGTDNEPLSIHPSQNRKQRLIAQKEVSMNDDPIILTAEENGKEKEYEVLDQILFNNQEYAFLLSYPDNASDSAELLIMHVTDEAFESVKDENLFNALLKIFSDKFKEFNIVD